MECNICHAEMNKVDRFEIVDPHEDIVYGYCDVFECPLHKIRQFGKRVIFSEYADFIKEIEKRLRGVIMDKYAVVTEEKEGEKTASDKSVCPVCGSVLVIEANVPKCPIHGTAPFEKESDEKGKKEKEEGNRDKSPKR